MNDDDLINDVLNAVEDAITDLRKSIAFDCAERKNEIKDQIAYYRFSLEEANKSLDKKDEIIAAQKKDIARYKKIIDMKLAGD